MCIRDRFYYGRFDGPLEAGGVTYDADFRNFTGISLSTNMGDFGSRLSYNQADLIMTQGGNELSVIPDFQMSGQKTTFIEAALTYDNGTNSVVAEWTQLDYGTASFLDDSAWLVSYAHRLDDISLHATYTEHKTSYESGTNGAIQKSPAAGLGDEESSIIVGIRYDYDSSTALKFEIQNSIFSHLILNHTTNCGSPSSVQNVIKHFVNRHVYMASKTRFFRR